jgi:hypothetical protein
MDTGDRMSYGDQGAAATKLEDLVAAGFPGELVVLPSGGSMTAARLARNLANPLTVTLSVGPQPPTPTAGSPTVPPPTRTPTQPPTRYPVFLPWTWKR